MCGIKQFCRSLRLTVGLALFALAVATPELYAQDEDFDSYKLRISAFWFRSNPSGNLQSAGQQGFGIVDINRDLNFDTFDTFSGKIDWKFTRKNHLYLVASPFDRSQQTVLNRTFV